MLKKVLIVDDDRIMLRLTEKKFQKYKSKFSVITVQDGLQAVEKLKEESISLVVTDLQMPRMDGFALLAHLSENYPDIPVIILTAYSTQSSRKAVLEGGAAGFMEKPFVVEKLAKKISDTLKRESEGGILQTIPLEVFLQLVEMEQKTCTIRIVNKRSGSVGVLFFKSGNLMDARIQDVKGTKAAYEIFSWDNVTLSIQDTCVVEHRQIMEDLQVILMEAMRRKDELLEQAGREGGRNASSDEIGPKISYHPPLGRTAAEGMADEQASIVDPDPVASRLNRLASERKWLQDVYHDDLWEPLMAQFDGLKEILNCDSLKVCYVNRGEATDFILLPGEKTSIITITPRSPRDRILQVLSE